jgi:CheY-like chemotaxis protein
VQTTTVLVVEHSEVLRRVITLVLQGRGYRVFGTGSGRDALELARRHRPDAVTLELALGDTDGRDVLRRLKQDAVTERIPIIVLSAFADALNPAERWYAADVLAKPFDVHELLRKLNRVLTHAPVDRAGEPAWRPRAAS